ncbi:selenide, water dikinase SelD [Simiduia agarivorans]|uniref:Selenide, water dikinase n=1 Tax=Simiduia agarivorans (strain DSM 21679 / JCM 13881 / BCRC 17597 / SA1) TaxID=1117647 RepID=K4KK64_SIMAS|nr:selenide, water dikinase SelD [Simiduia agarivorans]AFU99391.1 selenide, water dikinase [Simiduia agarivorans SA1 = DSM 21679]
MPASPILKDLVLLGGGHAHALVLRQWAMQPMPGVRLTLVSPEPHTPYSGMLPGLIAGQYSFDQTHIDLDRLCALTGARFIRAAATGIDCAHKTLTFDDRPPLAFDLLSVDVGGAPDLAIAGSQQAVPVKPISRFYARWQSMQASLAERPRQTIAIAGGGAAAVELAAALRASAPDTRIGLYFPAGQLLSGYSAGFRRKVSQALAHRAIELHEGARLTRIEPHQFETERGDTEAFDLLLLCTPVRAPDWLARQDIATDSNGFMVVNDHLQNPRYPWLFGAGDCVSLQHQPRPKAGVYAVRQAPVLFHNLRAALLAEPLIAYRAQTSFLSLLSLADGSALASRPGGFMPSFSGSWVWRWKDRIDRRFMAMFENLTAPMQASTGAPDARLWDDKTPAPGALAMRCGGCGAKVGGDILQRALAELETVTHPEVLIGLDQPDDAAAVRFAADTTLVQSVDQFRAVIDDPWLQGRIAALHALSDLDAMHAQPHTAQALVTLPYAADAISERDLGQLMQGAVRELNATHCQLTGGHTSEGAELSLGFAVNGVAGSRLMTKAGLQPGDYLLLTQPLGTGCLFAARAQGAARGRWISEALKVMTQSNRTAGHILFDQGAHACTDVTGFGLAGHLTEMLRASFVSARVNPALVPLLPGALELISQGWVSSLYDSNLRIKSALAAPEALADPRVRLWFDPQTSGGLLAALPPPAAGQALEQLRAAGYHAAIIGKVVPDAGWLIETGNFSPKTPV